MGKTADEKCDLFLKTLTGKYTLQAEEQNKYTDLGEPELHTASGFLPVRARLARKLLHELKSDKATKPDLLSARVLQRCASELSVPVAKLARGILST